MLLENLIRGVLMKNKLILILLFVAVMTTLFGCKSDNPGLTSEIGQFINENKLNYDEEGNDYGYIVERDKEKQKIIVKVESITEKMRVALEEEFGDLVEIVEVDTIATPVDDD